MTREDARLARVLVLYVHTYERRRRCRCFEPELWIALAIAAISILPALPELLR